MKKHSWSFRARHGKNYAAGVRPGVPDFFVVTAAGHLVAIEMKRIRGSTTSDDQRAWIAALEDCRPGVVAKICRGAGEAIEFVEEYLPRTR